MEYQLETDEQGEVYHTLISFHDFIQRADSDIYNWKWAIIALHNAVQGAMVVALRHTDGSGPFCEKRERKRWEHFEKTGELKPIEGRLLSFLELYEKVKKKGKIQGQSSVFYEPPMNQDCAMERLNNFRNEFIHFSPKLWTVMLAGAPSLCLSILDLPKFLLKVCPSFGLHENLTRECFENLINEIEGTLKSLESKMRG